MRLVERRRLVKKTRAAAESKVKKVVLDQLQSRYRSLKRELRKGNFRKRMKKWVKIQDLAKADPNDIVQPGDDTGWEEWILAFDEGLNTALMEGADQVGSIENEIWMSRGFPQYVVDPERIVSGYQARTGKQIKNIATDTRDLTLQAISDWYNTDAGLPTLIENLQEYFDEPRATLIATTEMGYVASEVAYDQMGEYGIKKWIWDAFDDFLTCPICADLNGQVFDREDPMPPDASHPNCRCGVLFAGDDGLELVAPSGELGKWAEDVERDDRGRWTGNGGGKDSMSRTQRLRREYSPGKLKDIAMQDRSAMKRQICEDLARDYPSTFMTKSAVNETTARWAHEASAEVFLHEAAAKEFGIPVNDWMQEKIDLEENMIGGQNELDNIQQQNSEIAKAIEANTQEFFKRGGYSPDDTITMWRGVRLEDSSMREGDVVNVSMNPLSSWTVDKDIAVEFSKDREEAGLSSYVFQADVPVKDIFSTAFTGPGCLSEAELIVKGFAQQGTVVLAEIRERNTYFALSDAKTAASLAYLNAAPGSPEQDAAAEASIAAQAAYDAYVAKKMSKSIKSVFVDDPINAAWPHKDREDLYPQAAPSMSRIPAGQLGKATLDPPYISLYGQVRDTSAWFVDGNYVRNEIYLDFTEGGNSARYNFVPEGEIWIDDKNADEVGFILLHELHEQACMMDGLSYDDAHNAANLVEQQARDFPEQLPQLLAAEGWTQVEKIGKASLKKWAEDTGRDESGRLEGEGGAIGTHTVQQAARIRISADKAKEPAATATMKDIASQVGGKLTGLDYRLKSEGSLTDKIQEHMEKGNVTADVAVTQITDGIRYTMQFEPDVFTNQVQATMEQLKAAGYDRYDHKFTNYFASNGPYRGLNTVWKNASTGTLFELQFHTEESQRLKDINHVMYNDSRYSQDVASVHALNDRMVATYMTFNAPAGSGGLH